MVENIHILQTHAIQTLVKACQQILPAAPIAIGTEPHIIASFGADNQFVPVRSQVFLQNDTKVFSAAPSEGP